MLIVVMDNQVIPLQPICQGCLMADQQGQPRWNQGQLRCGRSIAKIAENQPEQYECQMGFRIAHIE